MLQKTPEVMVKKVKKSKDKSYMMKGGGGGGWCDGVGWGW